MSDKVQVMKDGVILVELPLSMFPLDIKMPSVNVNGAWAERSYSWRITKRRDEKGQSDPEKPKGMQLQ